MGLGQRIGIFGGSGVGKSTLLGSMSRNNSADITVIALVGERNREVRAFLEHEMGAEGMRRAVVVVATSDRPAPLRVRACFTSLAIAEYFRDQGANVLLVMDSVTRLAMAQREIGLAAGEPPAQKGYTPSVFALLPKVFERAGNFPRGSITGFFTVLVEGDDFSEPICDAVRAILDGHIVLSRQLAAANHYPAIDVLQSVSRLQSQLASPEQGAQARAVRQALSLYRQAEDLIQLGAYVSGANPQLDAAIRARPQILEFLRQAPGVESARAETTAPAWPDGRRAGLGGCHAGFRISLAPRARMAQDPTGTGREQAAATGRQPRRDGAGGGPAGSGEGPRGRAVRQSAVVEAGDLWALAAYRQRLMAELQALDRRRGAKQVAAQRQKVLEAQRQCRLLEKLEQRRQAEWQREADREMESLAAESFLARWNRGTARL